MSSLPPELLLVILSLALSSPSPTPLVQQRVHLTLSRVSRSWYHACRSAHSDFTVLGGDQATELQAGVQRGRFRPRRLHAINSPGNRWGGGQLEGLVRGCVEVEDAQLDFRWDLMPGAALALALSSLRGLTALTVVNCRFKDKEALIW